MLFNNTIREQFPTLQKSVNGHELIYLDSAATTLKPNSVINEVCRAFVDYGTIRRGAYHLSEIATIKYEEVRELVQNFINAKDKDEIVFTPGTTYSINLVAKSYASANIKKDDEILITGMEHHSNILPWQDICKDKGANLKVIPVKDDGELDLDAFETLLNKKTKIVSLTYASNVLGTINPIKELIKRAHAYNAVVLVDAAQAAPHLKIDVQDLDCDFLAFSSHKIYGPYGAGVLYGKYELLDKMQPFITGGGIVKHVTYEKTIYDDIPQRFEAGTADLPAIIGMGTAIQFINNIGLENIAKYENSLLVTLTNLLKNEKDIRIIGNSNNKVPLVSFVMDDVHPHDISSILDSYGIAIRAGHHCAQPLMERLNIVGTCRASLGIYNTENEILKLIEALNHVRGIFR